jgi:hypothetical protein
VKLVFGFNTDVRVGGMVYHVQTEDRGPANPVIDTTIYCKGRIVHRRASSYAELLPELRGAPERLHQRLEEQHRAILEELRGGALQFAAPHHAQPAEKQGIQVQLLNPASWLAAGTATLEVEVRLRGAKTPLPGASVAAVVEGSHAPLEFSAQTDSSGRASLVFPMPRTGGGGMELVIRARAAAGDDEIRYSLRPKPRPRS